MAAKIPLTVITGFLGSGKTTLLDHILHDKTHKKRIAVIENEYGTPIGVQNEMRGDLGSAVFVAEIVETTSGCLCCAGRGNFIKVMESLLEHRNRFDYIIVETDGLSDPTFTRAFFQEPALAANVQLDGIVTLVDAKHILSQLSSSAKGSTLNEALEQIGVADRILLNKTDLVDDKTLKEVRQRLESINPTAEVIQTQYAKVDLSNVLDVKAFSLDRVQKRDPAFLELRPGRHHDFDIGAVSLYLTEPVPLDRFAAWLAAAVQRHNFMRFKGVVSVVGDERRHCFQGVSQVYAFAPQREWGTELRTSRMVFIARSLDKNQLLASLEKEVGVKPKDPGQAPTRGYPMLNTLILFAVTLLMFCPEEILKSLSNLPLFEYTQHAVHYRWWAMLLLVAVWILGNQRR